MPTPAEVLGREADHTRTWDELIAGGLPQPENITPGIYVVAGPDGLLYIGKSEDLNRRLGQFVGAAIGGWWLHSGGWRLFRQRQSGALGVSLTDLSFAIWEGQAAYDAEPELIMRCSTVLNVAGTIPPVDLSGVDLPALFALETGSAEREAVAATVLRRLVGALGRSAHPAESPSWSAGAWRGVGCRVGQRWKFTAYLGWRTGDGVVEMGLWSYEDDALWFGAQGAGGPIAMGPEELERLLQDWLIEWWLT